MTRLAPFGDRDAGGSPTLWIAGGPTVSFLGLPYPTRMAIARLGSGDLWVWSPVALDDALAAEVDALGPVRHLVAPNKLHHLYLGEWHERYPDARLYAAPALAAKRRDLAFDAELGDAADPAWKDEIDQVVFRGSFFLDEVVFVHRASRTALLCDLVQRFREDQFSGFTRVFMRLWGLVGERGSTPLEWRALWLRRDPARAALRALVDLEPENLVIAHGECAEGDATSIIQTGLRWL